MSGKLLTGSSCSDESDDDWDITHSSNKLNSLFTVSNSEVLVGNSALVYKAPKASEADPKLVSGDKSSSLSPRDQVTVVLALPVHCFLLKQDKFVTQGKLGLAVLEDKTKKEVYKYVTIVYGADKKRLCHVTFTTDNESLLAQPDNYVQFKDDFDNVWSVAFESYDHIIQFLGWYLVAKMTKDELRRESCRYIDLEKGDESSVHTVDSGSRIEIDYKEYSLEQGENFRSFVESNSTRSVKLSVGAGTVDNLWENSLKQARKGTKRLIICRTGDEKDFKLVVVNVKRIKKTTTRSTKPVTDSNVEPACTDIRIIDEETLNKDDTEQVKHQLLIDRIARIGHSVDPMHFHSTAHAQKKPSAELSASVTLDGAPLVTTSAPNKPDAAETQTSQSYLLPREDCQRQQIVQHCAYTCHCCHCAFYRNNTVANQPSSALSGVEGRLEKLEEMLTKKFEHDDATKFLREERLDKVLDRLESRANDVLHKVLPDKCSEKHDNKRVKKIMINLYQSLSLKFEPEQTYIGDEVRQIILDSIKTFTMEAIKEEGGAPQVERSSCCEQPGTPSG